MIEAGYDIRTVQELLEHKDVATTQIYTHVLNRGAGGVMSPLDRCSEPPAAYLAILMRDDGDRSGVAMRSDAEQSALRGQSVDALRHPAMPA